MIKVSIIVPVYNVEKYLRRCLDSLVSQTLQDIEIIVVNDASPDRSGIIMQEYGAKCPSKVKCVYSETNRCQGGARNIGIGMAQGEFLMFVDADDYVDATICEKLYNMALAHGYDTVYSDYYRKDESTGKQHKTSFIHDGITGELNEEKRFALCLSREYVVAQIIHKSLFQDGSLHFPENMKYEDIVFCSRHRLLSKRCGKVPEPLYTYALREDSTCGENNMDNIKTAYDMRDAAYMVLESGKALSPLEALMMQYAAIKTYINCFGRFLKFPNPPMADIGMLRDDILGCFSRIKTPRLLYTLDNINIIDYLWKTGVEDGMPDNPVQVYYSFFEKEIRQIFNSVTGQYKEVMLWGAGEKGIQFLKQFDSTHKKISWVGDNNPAKWGTELETGHKVINYKDIIDGLDAVIVTNRNFASSVAQDVHKLNGNIEIIDLENMIASDCIQEALGSCCPCL